MIGRGLGVAAATIAPSNLIGASGVATAIANEGKALVIVAPEDAEKVLQSMRAAHYGEEAVIVGEVRADPKGRVLVKTRLGSTRIVDMLPGEMLPRIC